MFLGKTLYSPHALSTREYKRVPKKKKTGEHQSALDWHPIQEGGGGSCNSGLFLPRKSGRVEALNFIRRRYPFVIEESGQVASYLTS